MRVGDSAGAAVCTARMSLPSFVVALVVAAYKSSCAHASSADVAGQRLLCAE